jgi:hypothetical protein
VLSAALFATFNEHLHLAGEWVVGGVEAKCFAYALVLLALRDLIDRRWNRVWLLLGAATAFHPLVGGWSGVISAGIWLINDRCTARFRTMLPGLIGGALLSLPGIVPALLLTWKDPPELVAEANRVYVFERLPHHLAPLTLPIEELARRLGGHTALVLLLTALIVSFRSLGVTGYASDTERASPLERIAEFAWGALLIAAFGFAIELVLWNDPLRAAGILRYYWFRLTDFALPMAAAMYATAYVVAALQQKQRWGAIALAALLAVAGWNIAHSTISRVLNPIPPADQKIRDYNAWCDACQWAAENTPASALFLTPRLNLTFKWRAGRAEVVNRKDIPQDADSIMQWHNRIRNIYYATIEGVEEPLDSLGVLGTEKVRDLALKYDADFVLMDRGQLLSLPIVYRNFEYVIYRIDRDEGRGPADGR